ncbi:MAG: glutamate formimidoyltransferase [Acidobacteriaceae bacterium]|nr:glutamate formimidoyltransferase [Acidobacteriaceae bacterium]MBV9444270.1 glutamate formimidoyltransferase [Acidobacteriaceae bacterium]
MIECVPNFSEGRDPAKVHAIEDAIRAVKGTLILDRTSDADHHRSVITFAGLPDSVLEAAVAAAAQAKAVIDLRQHSGVHPRLGALDVLPFAPLGTATLEDCVQLAHRAGERIWSELGVPVYYYEAAAKRADRRNLEDVRRGGFEVLHELVVTDASKAPDVGGPALHPTAGAVIVGARKILIAFNINLRTDDLGVARSIAKTIRASNGGLPGVKALGLPLVSRGLVQVSMNLTDFEITPPHVVYSEVKRLADHAGVEIVESEVIGLLPRKAIEWAGATHLKLYAFKAGMVIENRIESIYPGSHTLPDLLA